MSVSVEIAQAAQWEAARLRLAESLTASQTIAPMPRVCAELARLTAQQVTDAAQLAKLIQSDPVLAGEVMRVANSPAMRSRAPVVSLQQAVSWLGIAEVRNIGMAVMLRGEVFEAPGREGESEELWREAWLSGLWAKEIARERRKHVESAFLAALMHRTGAALALKVISGFEGEQRVTMDSGAVATLIAEFEPAFGRLLMQTWRMPAEVQDGASDWRAYRNSAHSDLAGTVHAAHLCAAHTLHPDLISDDTVVGDPVFESLGIFPDERRSLLSRRERVMSLGGL
jgi:HD-like signal output (HDOD) protein